MVELSFIIGVIGNIISVLVFLSPVDTFCRIVRHRSTEEFKSLPYICILLNASLWTYYGITKPGAYLVATVNGFGAVVELIYLILFLIYAAPQIRVRTGFLMGILNVGVLVAAISVTHFAMKGELRIDVIGLLCAGLNIVMYSSPLVSMKRVVATKSVEYMPFFLSFFLFLNGGIWAFYAILVKDPFLGVPNGIGCGLGIVQLVLYAIYSRQPSPSKISITSDGLEEGWQRERLLPSSPPTAQAQTQAQY